MSQSPRVLVLDAAPGRCADLLARLRLRGFSPQVLEFANSPNRVDAGAAAEFANPTARAALAVAETGQPAGAKAKAWSTTSFVPDPLPPADMAVALLASDPQPAQLAATHAVLQQLVAADVATVVCGGSSALRNGAAGPLLEWLAADADLGEVVGKLDTLRRYIPLVRGMERELNQLHRLGEQLNRYFGEIDQEMRLAGRLQRDFLPRELPCVGPYSFATLYRPASWVSGDLYDVQRIDEDHIGIFIADAMGHGVAAGLLTMFLRQALVPKRVPEARHGYSRDPDVPEDAASPPDDACAAAAIRAPGSTGRVAAPYAIVSPAEVLGDLHACLVRQRLPNSQFVTAVYGVLNTHTGELRLARAGHPYPVLIRPASGSGTTDELASPSLREVRSGGSLLGLADMPADFEETAIQLSPGDKLFLYTDGAEDALIATSEKDGDDGISFTPAFHDWSRRSAAELIQAVGEHLDAREGSLYPADDITAVVLEVAR